MTTTEQAAAVTVPGWLAELTAKYGEPRFAHPFAVDLGDRKRECWVWFPDGQNHNLGIDQFRDRWVIRSARPGGCGELTVRGKDRPSDAAIRSVLVTAGLLAERSHLFLTDPAAKAACPSCGDLISVPIAIAGPVLGDLIDAAAAHVCEAGGTDG